MAITLQITALSKTFNDLLFENINISLAGAAKIGLIGDNGCGKSTLLTMLASSTENITWSRDTQIGYLPQEINDEIDSVSGGEKKIIKLAQLFYGGYDVLLLDEPDNHLDIEHREWFSQMVHDFAGIVIIISHDRKFLRESTDHIWHMEDKKLRSYDYGYEKFREIYESEKEARMHLWQTQEKERKRLADFVTRMRAKAGANDKFASQLSNAIHRYDKYVAEMIDKPKPDKALNLNIKLSDQSKKKSAIHVKDLSKSYDHKVLDKLNLHLFCGEKIAIMAPNGSGKSTLLNIMVGKLKQDSGTVHIGADLRLGFYNQQHLEALDENATLIEEIQKTKGTFYYDAIGYLKRFKFDENQIKSPVKFLSGGQKSRLQLAKFFSLNPDILILDEPTNHLDLKTVLALENFLKNYTGTLILVSHDLELVHNTVSKIYDLKSGQLSLRTS
ncbi:MAG: ABC-F family ATP-binding cassette domain-containing protein [Candidatus Amesbacteria bacterium]|nr:ABC-F family ATP-binding cassette domain-containing protein [Candidatus Amesbacteria bacterium]